MYELESENLTHLGGLMGTEYTYANWRKFFSTPELAKVAAEMDYGKPLKWLKTKKGWRTEDLRYVMYHIRKVEVEK